MSGRRESTAVRSKKIPINELTRWLDKKGRAWRVLYDRYFGYYMCVLVDKPAYSGEWSAKDIRAAIAEQAQES